MRRLDFRALEKMDLFDSLVILLGLDGTFIDGEYILVTIISSPF